MMAYDPMRPPAKNDVLISVFVAHYGSIAVREMDWVVGR